MSAYAVSARGLASRRVPQGVLTPMNTLLFGSGEQGAWYDPADLSTLFQDTAGTTPVTAVEQAVALMLDKSGRGNHASQATSTKRPKYSRRVNLLTKTEDFSDAAAWSKAAGGTGTLPVVTPNAALAPDGTMTACQIVFDQGAGTTTSDRSLISQAISPQAVNYDGGLWLRTVSGTATLVFRHAAASAYLSVPVTTTWTYFSRRELGFVGAVTFQFGKYSTQATGSSTVLAWGASLTFAADAHLPYQRVNTATDYDADPNKFPAFGVSDGVDDSLSSATGGGGNAGFFFSAAVTVMSNNGWRILFSDAGANIGYMVRLNPSNQLELVAGNGSANTVIATANSIAIGATDIVQAFDDGVNLNVKIGNGATASIARPVVAAGTAGFTMGQNNGVATGFFNGRVYSTVYRKDSAPPQSQREAVATYQRTKARMP